MLRALQENIRKYEERFGELPEVRGTRKAAVARTGEMMYPTSFVLMPCGYTVRLWDGEDGFTIASCPEVPGCHAQGRDATEALRNTEDALIGYPALLEHDQTALRSTDASTRSLPTALTTATSPGFSFAWARSA